jgi:hypothetical protein
VVSTPDSYSRSHGIKSHLSSQLQLQATTFQRSRRQGPSLTDVSDGLLSRVLFCVLLQIITVLGTEVLICFQDAGWNSETCESTMLGSRDLASPCSLPPVLSVSSRPRRKHCGPSVPVSTGQQLFLEDPTLHRYTGGESCKHYKTCEVKFQCQWSRVRDHLHHVQSLPHTFPTTHHLHFNFTVQAIKHVVTLHTHSTFSTVFLSLSILLVYTVESVSVVISYYIHMVYPVLSAFIYFTLH